jgi:tetratricopeptide (TPR) repeat protein
VRTWDTLAVPPVLAIQGLAANDGLAGAGLAFSPDGRRLATVGGMLRVWDAATGQPLVGVPVLGPALPPAPNLGTPLLAVSFPDGDRVVTVNRQGDVTTWELPAGKPVATVRTGSGPMQNASFSRDGRLLATCREDFQVRVWDVATGKEAVQLQEGTADKGWCVAFDPEGERLASGGTDGRVRVWELKGGQLRHTLTGTRGYAYGVAWSPDGRRVAAGGEDAAVRVWDLKVGGEPVKLEGHTSEVHCVAFSADGGRIASGSRDRTVRFWDAAAGQEVITVAQGGMIYNLAFSPDGQRLATRSMDGITVWDGAPVTPETEESRRKDRERLANARLVPEAEAAEHAGRWDVAALLLRKLAELEPGNASYHSRLGTALGQLGEKDEALVEHDKAVAGQLDDWHFRLRRAQTLNKLGEPQKAVDDYTEGLRLYERARPRPTESVTSLYANRANAYGALGRWEEAAADYARTVEEVGDFPALWARYAVASLGVGDDAYRKVCAETLRRFKDTDDARDAELLAWCLSLRDKAVDDPDAVVRLAEKAVAAGKTGPRLLALAAALHRAGRTDEAAKRLEEVAKSAADPEQPTLWAMLAVVHAKLGHADEARTWLDKAARWLDDAPKAETAADRVKRNWFVTVPVGALRREAEEALGKPGP